MECDIIIDVEKVVMKNIYGMRSGLENHAVGVTSLNTLSSLNLN